jgi:hypothetical protein
MAKEVKKIEIKIRESIRLFHRHEKIYPKSATPKNTPKIGIFHSFSMKFFSVVVKSVC